MYDFFFADDVAVQTAAELSALRAEVARLQAAQADTHKVVLGVADTLAGVQASLAATRSPSEAASTSPAPALVDSFQAPATVTFAEPAAGSPIHTAAARAPEQPKPSVTFKASPQDTSGGWTPATTRKQRRRMRAQAIAAREATPFPTGGFGTALQVTDDSITTSPAHRNAGTVPAQPNFDSVSAAEGRPAHPLLAAGLSAVLLQAGKAGLKKQPSGQVTAPTAAASRPVHPLLAAGGVSAAALKGARAGLRSQHATAATRPATARGGVTAQALASAKQGLRKAVSTLPRPRSGVQPRPTTQAAPVPASVQPAKSSPPLGGTKRSWAAVAGGSDVQQGPKAPAKAATGPAVRCSEPVRVAATAPVRLPPPPSRGFGAADLLAARSGLRKAPVDAHRAKRKKVDSAHPMQAALERRFKAMHGRAVDDTVVDSPASNGSGWESDDAAGAVTHVQFTHRRVMPAPSPLVTRYVNKDPKTPAWRKGPRPHGSPDFHRMPLQAVQPAQTLLSPVKGGRRQARPRHTNAALLR